MKETGPAGPRRQIKAQQAGIETDARTDLETGYLVFVVADKKKWGRAGELPTLDLNLQIQKWETAEGVHRRDEKRGPLASPDPLLLKNPARNDLRIDPKARIVDESSAVYFAHIDGLGAPVNYRPHGRCQLERDPQVFRKMIQGADRQNAECFLSAGQLAGDGADRSITAPGYDRLVAAACDLPGKRSELASTVRSDNPRRFAKRSEQLRDLRLQPARGGGRFPRTRVDEHDHSN
jgi:hypothetical protein